MMNPTDAPYGEVQNALKEMMRKRIDENIQQEIGDYEKVTNVLVQGVPGEELIEYAKKNGADLIIVGVRRHSTLEKILVGSTTETVLRQAPCPVLTVPLPS